MATDGLLADEMLGRLARYLRMLGCDTVYAHGWTDEEIVRRARADSRIVLTRDRALAARADRAVRVLAADLPGQLREVVRAVPGVRPQVAFVRCTLCNGPLVAEEAGPSELAPPGNGAGPRAGTPVFVCRDCGHRYWEGSHTADVRRHLAEWIAPEPS